MDASPLAKYALDVALRHLVSELGSMKAVARALGVSPSNLNYLVSSGRPPPAEYLPRLVALADLPEVVTLSSLRPDLDGFHLAARLHATRPDLFGPLPAAMDADIARIIDKLGHRAAATPPNEADIARLRAELRHA